MCFPHVINIYCQHVITNFTNVELTKATKEFVAVLPPGLSDRQTFEEAIKWDPVALGHNIVRELRNSGQQHDLFDNTVRDGNEKGWLQVGNPPRPIQLPLVQLLRDVATRWDSVYYMVRCLHEMRPVS